MKHYLKLLIISTAFFLLTPFIMNAKSFELKDYFVVPKHISTKTELPKDIRVFYVNTEALTEVPSSQVSMNIFDELYIWDPLEPLNRIIFTFNDITALYVIRPLTAVYSSILPLYFREGIKRMTVNMEMPNRLINSLLQLRFKRAGIELARFGINTTVGIAGFYDPANSWCDLQPRNINFGQTFAYWGIGNGFYLVLPLLGSTSLRDGVGLVGDYFTNPITYIPPYTFWNWISWGIKVSLNFNAMTLNLDDFLRFSESSLDPYESMKNVWYLLDRIQNTRNQLPD